MDSDDGNAGCTDIDECASETHNCLSFYSADENGVTQGALECVNHNEGFACNCSAGFLAQEGKCALILTNASPTTENAMSMLIASVMLDHKAAHATLDGILLMVVQLGSMLRNVHSPVMMLFVTMSLETSLIDHSNVLASLTTQLLHVLTTTNAKMVPMMVMKMHYVPILPVACTCNSGFEGEGDVSTNIDECSAVDLLGPHVPLYTYVCTEPGYFGNGVECFDVDECNYAFGDKDCSNGANSVSYNIDGRYQRM